MTSKRAAAWVFLLAGAATVAATFWGVGFVGGLIAVGVFITAAAATHL